MDGADATLKRSLQIWWSFARRGLNLMIAVVIPIEAVACAVMFPYLPWPRSAQPPDPESVRRIAEIFPYV